MNDRSPNGVALPLLPRDVLFALLPAAFEPWGRSNWYPSTPPNETSVRRIQAEIGLRIPPLLVAIAAACPSYGGWFGSLGEDFQSHNHLLTINRAFRAEGVPAHYVLFNHGHDGWCNAWRLGDPSEDADHPVWTFWQSDGRPLRDETRAYASFGTYVDAYVRRAAAACPEKALRRRAKRLLSLHGG